MLQLAYMKIVMLIAVIVLAAVLFSANYFVYITFLRFFQITDTIFKKILLSGFLFLSLSFIFNSVISRFYSGLPIKIYYYISAVFVGLLLYFLLGSALAWLYHASAKSFGFIPDMKIVLAMLVGAALLVTAYGLANNERIRLKQVTATIDNLPPAWQGKSIAHISDLHLGIIHGPKHVAKVVETINRANPDIVVITGDYYDGTSPDYEGLARPLNGLRASGGVYFVNGNHETYIDTKRALAALSAAGVRPLNDEIARLGGLAIVGADYPTRGLNRDLAPLLSQVNPDEANILLYHEPRYAAEAKAGGIDLMLAGHVHAGQLWPIRYIDRLIYGKKYYGWHDDGDFAIYTTSGAGSWGPPLRVGTNTEVVLITLVSK